MDTCKIVILLLVSVCSAQELPKPTAHIHSKEAQKLALIPDLAWAAQYCDEENPYVQCIEITGKDTKKLLSIPLKGHIGTVALIMINGNIINSYYSLSHDEKPIGPLPPGQKSMTGLIYDDKLNINKRNTMNKKREMVVIFYKGYKIYTPHHPEDPKE